jgi:hypothetical protein
MKKLTQLEAQLYLLSFTPAITNPLWRIYAVSIRQLFLFLGPEWCSKNLQVDDKPSKKHFLMPSTETPEAELLTISRIITLADYLYNFYEIAGFSKYIYTFKSRTDIEASFAELEVAHLLKINGIPFKFAIPTGSKGTDYDLELILNNNTFAPCETKCKLESNDISENSIFNSLNEVLKRKQLPQDRPSVVFVSVPSLWIIGTNFLDGADNIPILSKDIQEKLNNAASRIFLKTSRILEIIFFSKAVIDIKNELGKDAYTFNMSLILDSIINQRSPFASQHIPLTNYMDEENSHKLIKEELNLSPRLPLNKRRWTTIKSLIS